MGVFVAVNVDIVLPIVELTSAVVDVELMTSSVEFSRVARVVVKSIDNMEEATDITVDVIAAFVDDDVAVIATAAPPSAAANLAVVLSLKQQR